MVPSRQVTVFLDSTEGRSFMRMVELKSEEDWLSLRENSWGIKEPSLDDLDSRTSLENILASGEIPFKKSVARLSGDKCRLCLIVLLFRLVKNFSTNVVFDDSFFPKI